MPNHPLRSTRQRGAAVARPFVRLLVVAFALRGMACASGKLGSEESGTDAAAPTPPATGGSTTANSGGGGIPAGEGGTSGGGGGVSTGQGGTSVQDPPPDAVNTRPTTGSCNPLDNTGCPAGKKCTILQQSGATFALGCVDVETKGEGDPCVQGSNGQVQISDDCGNGLACFTIAGDAHALCHRLCVPGATPNGCSASQACNLPIPGVSGVEVCRAATVTPNPDAGADAGTPTACKPLGQTGCAAGESCYFSSSGAVCWKTGSKNPGEACVSPTDCVKGSNCVSTGSSAKCATFCSTAAGGTPSCSDGSTCVAFTSAKAEPNLGYCK